MFKDVIMKNQVGCLVLTFVFTSSAVEAFRPTVVATRPGLSPAPHPAATTTTSLSFFSNSKTATSEQDVAEQEIETEERSFFTQFMESSLQNLNQKDAKEMVVDSETNESSSNAYVQFAKENPFLNNIMIATAKTAGADFLAQTALVGTSGDFSFDVQRSLLFALFGASYLGAFQYLYQVNVFKRLFDVDKFTSQPWGDKLKDVPGLKALAAQTGLDLTVLTLVYLPTFYIFKASVFSGSVDPSVWFSTGISTYQSNFSSDEADLIKVWLPADIVCFSVPLYLRLPVRHIVSFGWTAYLSFARGGH